MKIADATRNINNHYTLNNPSDEDDFEEAITLLYEAKAFLAERISYHDFFAKACIRRKKLTTIYDELYDFENITE